jgi:hypothetical protein
MRFRSLLGAVGFAGAVAFLPIWQPPLLANEITISDVTNAGQIIFQDNAVFSFVGDGCISVTNQPAIVISCPIAVIMRRSSSIKSQLINLSTTGGDDALSAINLNQSGETRLYMLNDIDKDFSILAKGSSVKDNVKLSVLSSNSNNPIAIHIGYGLFSGAGFNFTVTSQAGVESKDAYSSVFGNINKSCANWNIEPAEIINNEFTSFASAEAGSAKSTILGPIGASNADNWTIGDFKYNTMTACASAGVIGVAVVFGAIGTTSLKNWTIGNFGDSNALSTVVTADIGNATLFGVAGNGQCTNWTVEFQGNETLSAMGSAGVSVAALGSWKSENMRFYFNDLAAQKPSVVLSGICFSKIIKEDSSQNIVISDNQGSNIKAIQLGKNFQLNVGRTRGMEDNWIYRALDYADPPQAICANGTWETDASIANGGYSKNVGPGTLHILGNISNGYYAPTQASVAAGSIMRIDSGWTVNCFFPVQDLETIELLNGSLVLQSEPTGTYGSSQPEDKPIPVVLNDDMLAIIQLEQNVSIAGENGELYQNNPSNVSGRNNRAGGVTINNKEAYPIDGKLTIYENDDKPSLIFGVTYDKETGTYSPKGMLVLNGHGDSPQLYLNHKGIIALQLLNEYGDPINVNENTLNQNVAIPIVHTPNIASIRCGEWTFGVKAILMPRLVSIGSNTTNSMGPQMLNNDNSSTNYYYLDGECEKGLSMKLLFQNPFCHTSSLDDSESSDSDFSESDSADFADVDSDGSEELSLVENQSVLSSLRVVWVVDNEGPHGLAIVSMLGKKPASPDGPANTDAMAEFTNCIYYSQSKAVEATTLIGISHAVPAICNSLEMRQNGPAFGAKSAFVSMLTSGYSRHGAGVAYCGHLNGIVIGGEQVRENENGHCKYGIFGSYTHEKINWLHFSSWWKIARGNDCFGGLYFTKSTQNFKDLLTKTHLIAGVGSGNFRGHTYFSKAKFHRQSAFAKLDYAKHVRRVANFQMGPTIGLCYEFGRQGKYSATAEEGKEVVCSDTSINHNFLDLLLGIDFDGRGSNTDRPLNVFGKIACDVPCIHRHSSFSATAYKQTITDSLSSNGDDKCFCICTLGIRGNLNKNWKLECRWNGKYNHDRHANDLGIGAGRRF